MRSITTTMRVEKACQKFTLPVLNNWYNYHSDTIELQMLLQPWFLTHIMHCRSLYFDGARRPLHNICNSGSVMREHWLHTFWAHAATAGIPNSNVMMPREKPLCLVLVPLAMQLTGRETWIIKSPTISHSTILCCHFEVHVHVNKYTYRWKV